MAGVEFVAKVGRVIIVLQARKSVNAEGATEELCYLAQTNEQGCKEKKNSTELRGCLGFISSLGVQGGYAE